MSENAATLYQQLLEAWNARDATAFAGLFPDDGRDTDTLLKHADVAMYRAKSSGRNNFQFFAPEMNERAFERMEF